MKHKSQYACVSCGYQSQKWMGKCPACFEWNTLQEEIVMQKTHHEDLEFTPQSPVTLDQISEEEMTRYSTHISELNRVLGGQSVFQAWQLRFQLRALMRQAELPFPARHFV